MKNCALRDLLYHSYSHTHYRQPEKGNEYKTLVSKDRPFGNASAVSFFRRRACDFSFNESHVLYRFLNIYNIVNQQKIDAPYSNLVNVTLDKTANKILSNSQIDGLLTLKIHSKTEIKQTIHSINALHTNFSEHPFTLTLKL